MEKYQALMDYRHISTNSFWINIKKYFNSKYSICFVSWGTIGRTKMGYYHSFTPPPKKKKKITFKELAANFTSKYWLKNYCKSFIHSLTSNSTLIKLLVNLRTSTKLNSIKKFFLVYITIIRNWWIYKWCKPWDILYYKERTRAYKKMEINGQILRFKDKWIEEGEKKF